MSTLLLDGGQAALQCRDDGRGQTFAGGFGEPTGELFGSRVFNVERHGRKVSQIPPFIN